MECPVFWLMANGWPTQSPAGRRYQDYSKAHLPMPIVKSGNRLQLTDKKLLAKNTLWNLAGQVVPALVALVSVPIIIHKLGTDRFGVLALAWSVIGYFSLFDFGLGRAVTQLVARKLGAGEEKNLPGLIWTALTLLSGFGIIGAVVAALVSPLLVHRLLHVPEVLQPEALDCFYIMAASIPILAAANVFNGLLEARQKFNRVNLIRIPLGIANFLLPLFIIPFTQKTYWLVALLGGTRLLGLAFYFRNCLQVFPNLWRERRIQWNMARPLLGFGGWMTVSNIISPLMVTLDRFLIGSVLTVSAVAYYATPYELASRLNLFSGPLLRVLFPAFSASHQQDRRHSTELLKESAKFLFIFLSPVVLVIVLFSKEILGLWLGADFATQSQTVLQFISIGVLINILAQLLFAYLQGAGRPDLPAKNHMFELPIYIVVLFLMLKKFGIEGAAAAWLFRVTLDSGLLYWQAHSIAFNRDKWFSNRLIWMMLAFSVLLIFPFTSLSVALKIMIGLTLCLVFSVLVWKYYILARERAHLSKLYQLVLKKML